MDRSTPEETVDERAPLFARVLRPLQEFFRLEAASGIVLLGAAAAALVWANFGDSYEKAFTLPIVVGAGGATLTFTLRELVNDGLMTLFFFLVGMEIKRELVVGELRSFGRAALPAVAAVGGMVAPALVYLAFNRTRAAHPGWGVPTATDVAFCIGVLTLLRRRVPQGLVVFITALAIFDDIGGIIVIAAFYGTGIHVEWLAAAAVVAACAFASSSLGARRGRQYALLGFALWFTLQRSGINATLAGVLLGLAVPARVPPRARELLRELADHTARVLRRRETEQLETEEVLYIAERLERLEPPLARFVHRLHPFVAFGVMPAFALANSGVSLRAVTAANLTTGVTLGVALGLVLGKPAGIFSFTVAAVRLGLAPMPGRASFTKLLGVSAVGGIGFTVALFIAALAFRDPAILAEAKVGILAGSLLAGLLGSAIVATTPKVPDRRRDEPSDRRAAS